MLKAILSIVLAWTPTWYPPGSGPETSEERNERRTMIAEAAIHSAHLGYTEFWQEDNVALLLTIWKFESGRLDYHVHGSEESPIGHQDHGHARCLGQLHQNDRSEEEWLALAGRSREATLRCARATQEAIWYHAERCKLRRDIPVAKRWRAPLAEEEVRLLIAAYGDGHRCDVSEEKWVNDRFKTYARLRDALQ